MPGAKLPIPKPTKTPSLKGVTGTTKAPGKPAGGVKGAAKVPVQHGHALLSAHTLGEAAGAVGHAVGGALHAAYGGKRTPYAGGTGNAPPGLAVARPVSPSFAKATSRDVATMGEFPFVGGWKAAQATAALAKGETKPAKELGTGLVEGLKHGALGELAQGHLEGAERAAQEHPGMTLAETAGAVSAVGRGAGALSRAAKMGIGQRIRSPIALEPHISPETAMRGEALKYRTFSGDLTRKAVQVRADLAREPLRDSNGHIVTIKDRGRSVPVLLPTAKEAKRLQEQRANFASARAVGMQRAAREEAAHAALQASTAPGRLPLALRAHIKPTIRGALRPVHVQGKIIPLSAQNVGEHLAQLVASGTIRPKHFAEDLQAHIDRIRTAVNNPSMFRHRGELAAAEGNLSLLEAAASHPSVMDQAERIAKQGRMHGRQLNAYDKKLAENQVYPAEQLERARLSEYALAHMDARHSDAGFVDRDGKLITNAEIKAHMRAHGVNPSEVAYLPHRMVTAEAKKSFYKPFVPGRRLVGNEPKRTGALYKRGATAMTTTMLHEELANKATTLANVHQFDRMVRDQGRLHPAMEKAAMGEPLTPAEQEIVKGGGYFNAKEAGQWADKLEEEGFGRYVPMRAFASKLSADAQKGVMEAQAPSALEDVRSKMLNDRIVHEGDTSTARNVVLVPEDYANRLMAQAAPVNYQPVRMLQMLNNPFRMAVLAQPRWLTGNFIEPYFVRLPLSGSGVNIPGLAMDLRAGTKVMKELEKQDPKAAAEVRSIFFSGRFLGGKQATVRRTTYDVPATAFMRKLPVVKQLGHLIAFYPKLFFAFNRVAIEDPTALAALGKQARHDIQAATGHWTETVKLGDAAVKDAAKGLVNTANQHRYAEYYWELLGQYDGFKPALKQLIQTATPFLPWTLASLRFVYWTLPAHHTVAFAGLMKTAQSVIKEWEAEHKDFGKPSPGELALYPRSKKGGYIPVPRYTPFGISIPVSQGPAKAISQVEETFLPQVSGSIEAFAGRDPFGRPLQVPKTKTNPKGEPTEAQKTEAGLYSLGEALVPMVSQIRRLREKGGTAYGTSTVWNPQVKPGTNTGMSAFERTFNPFRPTYLKPPKGSKPKKTPRAKLGPAGGASLGPSGGSGLGPSR
ncbi:MAG TPA: hypothetical protein VMT20_07110 [Terriglobia bacterium]|nr:hypothetical protein [Terriglobia bacterium]